MAKVAIRLYATLKDIAQASRVEVDAKNVAEAINLVSAKFGVKFSQTLYDDVQSVNNTQVVRNCFSLVVNSEMVGLKNLDRKELAEGDIIHIFPPIAGGSMEVCR